MKKISTIVYLFVVLSFTLKAQELPEFVSGFATGSAEPKSIIADSMGNTYVLGIFDKDSIDIDPSANEYWIKQKGHLDDCFFAKYTASGDFDWGFALGTDGGVDDAGAVRFLANGDVAISVYLAGTDSVEMNPLGLSHKIRPAISSLQLARYNPMGQLVWSRGVLSGQGKPDDMYIDADDNVYFVGNYRFNIDFDPGAGQILSYNVGTNYGIYITKYDSSNTYKWHKNFGPVDGSIASAVKSISSFGDEVYATVSFDDRIYPDETDSMITIDPDGGQRDLAVISYDTSGDYNWHKNIRCSGTIELGNTVTDLFGNLYVTGRYSGMINMDFEGAGTDKNTNGSYDLFLASYEPNGNLRWENTLGSKANDFSSYVGIGRSNRIHLMGRIHDTTDFDLGVEEYLVVPNDGEDYSPFYATYSNSGQVEWAVSFGGLATQIKALAFSPNSDNIFCAGTTPSGYDFGIEEEHIINGTSFMVVQYEYPGCEPSTKSINYEICFGDSIMILGEYRKTPGTFKDTVPGMFACDTIVSHILDYEANPTKTINYSICRGDSIMILGQFESTPGSYKDTIPAIGSCDTVINHVLAYTIDTTITIGDSSLTSNTVGATYQWFECNLGMTMIAGATDRTYMPEDSGYYQVTITKDSCSATSACIEFVPKKITPPDTTSIFEVSQNNYSMFPNPTKGELMIKSKGIIDAITLFDVAGKKLYLKKVNGVSTIIDLASFEKGVYFVELSFNDGRVIDKVVRY